ncbi:hypothetical protein KPH14_002809 [Odynerus spinipes]|uniref:Uncharacterized protein n=1 Tax=Odynerus spinipes TaxID=1348599 RepID=A0AAD9RFX4_9HYME|nr:hypothetical protein KPH14_002809 [Odynerus spinipes]
MNRLAITLFALVSVALAIPVEQQQPVKILRQSAVEPGPDGSYNFSYETENGIQVEEQGQAEVQGDVLLKYVTGSFTYTAPDGTPIRVDYTADSDGFHPQGEHLPVAPEVPAHIQRALEYIAAHPEENEEESH